MWVIMLTEPGKQPSSFIGKLLYPTTDLDEAKVFETRSEAQTWGKRHLTGQWEEVLVVKEVGSMLESEQSGLLAGILARCGVPSDIFRGEPQGTLRGDETKFNRKV